MVVAGKDMSGKTIDEISNIGPTKITQRLQGVRDTYTITPEVLGLELASYDEIKQGLNTKENAEKLMAVLNNKANSGMSDIVILNAAALIYLSEVADTLENGISLARKYLENGDAYRKFIAFRDFSNKLV
jgi:anthranilate phosphoribosyltransferase